MNGYVYLPDEAAHYGKTLFGMVERGELNIKIFAEYPFTAEGVKQAQSDLTEGKTTGKVIIKV